MRAFATLLFMMMSVPMAALASPEIGKPAPDFSAKTISGEVFSLKEQKGHLTVLEWTNHECPFVKKHYDSGNMQALQMAYTQKGVRWVRINSSAEGKQGHLTPEQAKDIIVEQKVAATDTVLDADGKVGKLYEAKTTPHMFIVDAKGKLAYMGAIDSIRSPNPADIEKATPYVADALDALLEGKPVETASTQPYGCGVKY
jgi:alkyl hydroperoxide reductase subunit AhpC